MKKVCFILLLSAFFSNTSMAKDSCQNHLENLENRLEKCTISYSENASTSDMNKATYDAADCAIQIANELFDTYYMSTKEESKAFFNQLVAKIYEHAHHLKEKSDYAKRYYTGTLYNQIAIGHAEDLIQKLVKSYLKELQFECEDRQSSSH